MLVWRYAAIRHGSGSSWLRLLDANARVKPLPPALPASTESRSGLDDRWLVPGITHRH